MSGEDLAPFAERLVGGDQQRSALVARADQFEQDARLRLVLGEIGEIVEDQQVIFVELGDRGFEDEIAARELKLLDEVGGSGEQHAPALFDQGQADRGREMGFSCAGRDSDMAPGFWRVKGQSTTRFIRLRAKRWRRAVGASCTEAWSTLYQVIKRPTLLPISQISCDLIQRRRGDFDTWQRLFRYAVISTGRCFGPLFWRKRPGAPPGACYLSSRFMTAARARTQPRSGAWGSTPFAIGSSGSISGGRMASSTASRPGIPRNSMTSKGARSSQWSRPVRPRRSMGSCAGG